MRRTVSIATAILRIRGLERTAFVEGFASGPSRLRILFSHMVIIPLPA
jgi:hypothetical protein